MMIEKSLSRTFLHRRILPWIESLLVVFISGGIAPAQGPPGAATDYAASTLVLFNTNVPESKEVAQFYAKAREIPAEQVVGLACSLKETITPEEYSESIQKPLIAMFQRNGWWRLQPNASGGQVSLHNKIKVVATVHGMPLSIGSPPPPPVIDPKTGKAKPQVVAPGSRRAASVDSELMRLPIVNGKFEGAINNPYYKKDEVFLDLKLPILLSGRIDGPTVEDARRLITDAITAEAVGLWGKVYVDLAQKTNGGYKEGEESIARAGRHFLLAGFPAVVDTHQPTFPINYPMHDAAAYFGWYSSAVDGPFKNPDFRFKKGAIAAHLHSFSAFTLRSDSKRWAGPLVSKGAAAVLGNVFEPYLSLTTRFDIFAARLLKGYTLAESAAMGTPGLSWMTVVVGDPLYRPFGNVDPSLDRRTDYDYKTFHMAMKRWGNPKQKDELFKNLEVAARKQRSGNLFEAMGQLTQEYYPRKLEQATKWYDEAARAFREPADQLRVQLLKIDMLRRRKGKQAAINQLEKLVVDRRYAKIAELEAAKALLLRLNPPPPPPPEKRKKGK